MVNAVRKVPSIDFAYGVELNDLGIFPALHFVDLESCITSDEI